MIALLPIAYSTGTSDIITGLHDQLRQVQIVAGSYVLTRDFVSSFHCVIGTRYWYQLNLMEETQCLQQVC